MDKYINVQSPENSVEAARKRKAAEAVYVIDLQKLQDKFLTVLYREAKELLHESYDGKLGKSSAEDLVRYSKLIKELMAKQEKEAENLTTEQLKDLVGDSEK